jgi:5-formyltetrahydrofolate cyclo-ligase
VTSDAHIRKERLRATVLATRGRIATADRSRAGAAIAAHGLAAWSGLGTVAAHLSFGSEPPTADLLDGLLGSGRRVLLPIIDGDRLDWASYSGPADVAPGPLGIDEPTGTRLGSDALHHVDLVIVPALAVDRAGHRLGRGRGYYDRALVDVTASIVAVGYDDELVDDVPAERHDRLVDGVLSPRGLAIFR